MPEIPPAELSTLGGPLCPVCLSPVGQALELGEFHLFSCQRCECWSSDALQRDASTSFSPDRYFANADVDRKKWADLLTRLQRRGHPVGSVLDIGCGTGAFLGFAGQRIPGTRQVGIELDERRVAEAREANPTASIHAGDAMAALDAITGDFDLITLWDVFEHVPAPALLLDRLAARLSAHGCIYIQTIHEASLIPALGRFSYKITGGRWRAVLRRTHDAHHLVFFSRRGLVELAARSHLKVDQLWFGRLARARMDGHPLVTSATSLLLAIENALGNGLFLNVILSRQSAPP